MLLGNELLLACAVLHSNRLLRPLYLRGRTFVGLCLSALSTRQDFRRALPDAVSLLIYTVAHVVALHELDPQMACVDQHELLPMHFASWWTVTLHYILPFCASGLCVFVVLILLHVYLAYFHKTGAD